MKTSTAVALALSLGSASAIAETGAQRGPLSDTDEHQAGRRPLEKKGFVATRSQPRYRCSGYCPESDRTFTGAAGAGAEKRC